MALIGAMLLLNGPGCGDPSSPADPRLELALASLDALLAATPEAGRTPGSNQAIAELVRDQFRAAGVDDVTIEMFTIPVSSAANHALSFAGVPELAGAHPHEVNVFGGAGNLAGASIVDVGVAATPMPPAAGKVAMLDFSVTRSLRSQYKNVIASGAIGALIDSRIDALRQRNVWTLAGADAIDGPIPIVTIEKGSAAAVRTQLELGSPVTVDLRSDASVTSQQAYNVIAQIPGTTYPDRTLVINGHLDSWFTGAADDGQAVAGLVALASALAAAPLPFTVELVAFDCEETFLLGSNDYLRRRLPAVRDQLIGAISLEMLAPRNVEFAIATLDPKEVWLPAAQAGGLIDSFDLVFEPSDQMTAFGGEIPSDQGNFWQFAIPGMFVVATYDEYHTVLDDAANTDPVRFGEVLAGLEGTLRELGKLTPEALAVRPRAGIEVHGTLSNVGRNRLSGTLTAVNAQAQTPVEDATVTVTLFDDAYADVLATAPATLVPGAGYAFQLNHQFVTGRPYLLSIDAIVAGKASGRDLVRVVR